MFRNFVAKVFLLAKLLPEKAGKSGLKTSVRHFAARKRFYKKANVLHSEGKFEVTLDQRKLKTPKGNVFYVESEPLALAVAAEWNRQETYIVPANMHLTGLCYTVLDNPTKSTKEDHVQKLIKYLDTDTILYVSGEEDDLYELQIKEWQPILEWFCKRFDVDLQSSKDISGPIISSNAKAVLTKHFMSYNSWAVHGFVFAIEALKSVILGLTCAERHISVEKAVFLSRLEEEYQIKRWGRVEWSHELNQQDSQARVAAGILFVYFNSSSYFVRRKSEII